MHHEATESNESNRRLLPLYQTAAGTVLLVIGVILGIYVSVTAFGLIRGQQPPGLVRQFTAQAAAQSATLPDGATTLQLPPGTMQACIYLLTFLLLGLPTLIAAACLRAGARLMHGDTAEALQKLAERLGDRSSRRRS